MTEWDDRWVDAALHELHGQRPPDLSARVVNALERGPVDASPIVVTAAPGRSRPVLLAATVVAMLAALVAVTMLLVQRQGATPAAPEATDRVVARLAIEVQSGVVSCVEAALGGSATSRHPAGTSASFDARPGNRLRCAMASQMRLGPFGVVECSADSELEVKSMEFTWKSGVVAASSLTVAVVAGVVTWHNLARSETAAAGETLRMHAPSDGEGTLIAENAELKRQLERLQRENEALKVQPSRESAAATVVADAPKVEPDAPPVAQVAMMFTDDRFAPALAGVDWQGMGVATKDMAPKLVELLEAIQKGEDTTELRIKIQEINGKLVAQVPALLKAGLPGYGPNGSYTHPLVAANVLASTLAAAGRPLDDAQRAKIDGLVRAFSAESQSIADTPGEFEIERLVAEVEMKDRFFREMGSHLAPEQNDTMNPAGSLDRDGTNLFSTGLLTNAYAEPIPAKSPADFARLASNRLGEDLGLDESAAAKVRAIVERVTAAAPEMWSDPADGAETNYRLMKRGRAQAALKRQIEIMREIQRTVPMTPEQLKKFRASKGVLVPLPR